MCEEIQSQIKPKLLSNSHPGVYQLDCSCNGRYIGESKKKVLTRCIENHPDSTKGNFESSGITENTTGVSWTIQLDSPENNFRNAKHVQEKGA